MAIDVSEKCNIESAYELFPTEMDCLSSTYLRCLQRSGYWGHQERGGVSVRHNSPQFLGTV